jgi:hypothetical protein
MNSKCWLLLDERSMTAQINKLAAVLVPLFCAGWDFHNSVLEGGKYILFFNLLLP